MEDREQIMKTIEKCEFYNDPDYAGECAIGEFGVCTWKDELEYPNVPKIGIKDCHYKQLSQKNEEIKQLKETLEGYTNWKCRNVLYHDFWFYDIPENCIYSSNIEGLIDLIQGNIATRLKDYQQETIYTNNEHIIESYKGDLSDFNSIYKKISNTIQIAVDDFKEEIECLLYRENETTKEEIEFLIKNGCMYKNCKNKRLNCECDKFSDCNSQFKEVAG